MEEVVKKPFYQLWGFWGLFLIGLSYVISYSMLSISVELALNPIFTRITSVCFWAGVVLAIVGLGKDVDRLAWSIASICFVVLSWVLPVLGWLIFY